jgi:glycosyltransferase involved in cell wall biosynthesis
MITVSLVIPGRNCAGTLPACLDALLVALARPGCPVIERFFVDDGSTDGSAAIAAARGFTVIRGRGAGAGSARNLGWRAAKGDLVWFVDSDCVAAPDAIELLLPHFAAPEVIAVGGAYDNGCPESLLATLIHEEIAARHRAMPTRVNFLASFHLAYRRTALERLGGFDERYLRGQDAELSYRAAELGYVLHFEHGSRVAHFHETRLGAYLRTQRLQGYWRAFLHAERRGHAAGDSYSRLSDHLQPPVALLLPATALLMIWPGRWEPAAAVAGLLALLQLPMLRRLWPRLGPTQSACFAAMSAVRALWRGLGLAQGCIGLALTRGKRPGSAQTEPTHEP